MYVEILESAFLCDQKVFLHRLKFVLGQLGDCGFIWTIPNDQIWFETVIRSLQK